MKKHKQKENHINELCYSIQSTWDDRDWNLKIRLFLEIFKSSSVYFIVNNCLSSFRKMDYEET